MYCTKAKGRFLLRDFAPYFPISKIRRRCPDHNYSSLQSCSGRSSGARRFPYPSVITFAVRAPRVHPAAASRLSAGEFRLRFPCGPRCRFSCQSSFPEALAGLVSSSPEVPSALPLRVLLRIPLRVSSPVPLRVPVRVLRVPFLGLLRGPSSGSRDGLVYSLLLEDFSSVDS